MSPRESTLENSNEVEKNGRMVLTKHPFALFLSATPGQDRPVPPIVFLRRAIAVLDDDRSS